VIVRALDGTDWKVTRRADGVALPAAIAFIALTIAAWAVAIVLVVPAILLLLEILLGVILILPGGREYVVAASNGTTGELRTERIRGRRRSRDAERELARELSRGA
jgi:hypothetical protein